jgi:hypothetical protein
MKTFNRQKLDVVNMTRSNLFGWRSEFTPVFRCLRVFNPVEFDGFRTREGLIEFPLSG